MLHAPRDIRVEDRDDPKIEKLTDALLQHSESGTHAPVRHRGTRAAAITKSRSLRQLLSMGLGRSPHSGSTVPVGRRAVSLFGRAPSKRLGLAAPSRLSGRRVTRGADGSGVEGVRG